MLQFAGILRLHLMCVLDLQLCTGSAAMCINFFDSLRTHSLLAARAVQYVARPSKPALSRAGVRYAAICYCV